ncbi:MAG: phospho-N-acetylmuramoyl-pentapeptide-transferase [Chlamydiae bacterium]|nr:phospho-N-acetylmuramoyl-pentapeptide-transferase [Chlamydiota bacterium]MBI3267012.1 phospho-N-acetylmuramoyl-pentapeptide-transferase [Chlamydiota bacterium]
MLYHLLYPLREIFSPFNVFRYITFRAAFAAVTAFAMTLFLGPWLIRKLYSLKVGQNIRKEECPPLFALHRSKEGTPTMGGALILLAILISVFLWSDLTNHFVWITVFCVTGLGFLGAWDDYLKLKNKRSLGVRAKTKFVVQILLAVVLWLFMRHEHHLQPFFSHVSLPFLKNWTFDLGFFYLIFLLSVFVGSSNAVNLTDGLDGLAIGCVTVSALVFSALTYLVGNVKFATYLQLQPVAGVGELTVFCASLVGAGLGFLWYNAYPAQVFMGDTGSLALGGSLGVVALLSKQEMMLFIVGGVFVIEALSVMLQVGSFKLRRKRIFKMAPLHHHFEVKGWPETKVTIRFWILAAIFALLSLGVLKLR